MVCILSPRQDDFNSTALSVFIPEQQAVNISKRYFNILKNCKHLGNLQLISEVKEDTSSVDRVKSSCDTDEVNPETSKVTSVYVPHWTSREQSA